MKKLMIGLVLTAICGGVGATAWATTNNGEINRNSVNVQPVNNNIKSEIENYINNTYGSNWAIDLYEKNGEEWDEILEDDNDDMFDDQDDINDIDDNDDQHDNDDINDTHYDDHDVNDRYDD